MEITNCKYVKTIFENNSFIIGVFGTEDNSVPVNARSKYNIGYAIEFTALGYNLPQTDAVNVHFEGDWEKSKYGFQLKVTAFKETPPETKEGVIAYLSSGLIKGIGLKTAKAIVNKFGPDTMKVIENEPKKLTEIKGISQNKLEKIISSITENAALKESVEYLAPFGISTKKIAKVYEKFGENTIKVIKDEPFKLCEISGFGFKTTDLIARKANCDLTDKLRIKGGINYALDEAFTNGHLYLPETELFDSVYDLLNDGMGNEIVSMSMIADELRECIADKSLVINNENIYRQYVWQMEVDTALKITEILKSPIKSISNIDKEIRASEDKLKIRLSNTQVEAVKMCFNNSISVITGGPGTGKTTILKVILDIYKNVINTQKILLAAPTGLAARRMADATDFPASTLHSALGLNTKDPDEDEESSNNYKIIDYDFVIVDETSMVDMSLANELFKRLKSKIHVLFVGDVDQLPSVGAGNVLREIIKCGVVAVTKLDAIFRQKQDSCIAVNAHAINSGDSKLIYGTDFSFVNAESSTEAAELIKEIYQTEVSDSGIENVQILTPFRKRGDASSVVLNEKIRELVNPKRKKKETTHGLRTFRVGDKVIQTKNTDRISNGDIGFIKDIAEEDEELVVSVEFSGGRIEKYVHDDLEKLDLAYSITIHKSQGSEYKTVIIPVLTDQYIMLRRNLIYTAITRAKKKVILVGQKRALFIAIGKNDIDKRNTMLSDRIYDHYIRRMKSKVS